MNLFPFFLITLGAFAILHFAWIPSAERHLRIDRSMATIKRAALLSLLGFARSIFLIATLTAAALILIVFTLQMLGGVTAAEVTSAIESIHRWRMLLRGIGPWWGASATVLLVLALGIYARRSGRLRMEKTFQKMYARKLEQLKRDYELGKLKEMPPTPEMREVSAAIGELNALLEGLEREDLLKDPKAAAARHQLVEQIEVLQKYYFALDVQRRIDFELDPDEASLPEARTKWEKLQTFFISRGLLASLSKTSRALFLASLILLVPSLTGVYSIGTTAALNNRLVQLKDLRVELSRKEFEQEKARLGNPSNELSEEDEQALQEVASAYERTTVPVFLRPGLRPSMYAMRSMLVRETVLAHAAKHANNVKEQSASGAVWEQHPSGSSVEGLTDVERNVVKVPEKAIRARGPITPQGQRVYAELQDVARRSPSFMQNIRNGLRSFQRPASSYDISHALFNQIAGTLAGEAPGEFGNVLSGVEFHGPKMYRGFTEVQSRHFLFNLMRGTSLDDALRGAAAPDMRSAFVGPLEQAEFHSTMRTVVDDLPINGINEKLADYPPSVDVMPEKHVDMTKARDAVNRFKDKMASVSRIGHHEIYADSIATFSDWFPAQLGAEARTRRGELLARWNGDTPGPGSGGGGRPGPIDPDPNPGIGGTSSSGGGGGGGGIGGGGGGGGGRPSGSGGGGSGASVRPTAAAPKASRFSFLRARSFGGLRGFSRVGGVLIGQTPADAATAKPNFVDLRWEVEGPHVRFVLVQSDGQQLRSRPHRMSVAYHALNYAADGRPLAVTMTEAAPLKELKILLHPTLVDSALGHRIIEVDRFVDTFTVTSELRKEAQQRVAEHHILYSFAWAVRALAFLEAVMEGRYDTKVSDYQQELRNMIADEQLRKAAAAALADPAAIGDPQKSPLTVKKEFYDHTLVEMLTRLQPGTTLDALSWNIRAQVTQEVRALKSSEDKAKGEALFERWMSPPPKFEPVSGVHEHDFNTSPANILVADGAEIPVPFSYMLQVAFTSPPAFVDEATAEGYADTQPWEFPLLRDMIQTTVTGAIEKDKTGRTQSIVADVSEFIMLQRMFRMAFNGHLGEDFPVEKMTALSEVLAAGSPKTVTRTLRWNALPFDPFAVLINRVSGRDRELLTNMQEIRKALGVDKDSEQVLKTRGAPLPALD